MGYSCVTTTLAAAANQNLTDLATVKMELGLSTIDTAKDAWLSGIAIPQVSASISRFCNHNFAPELLQDAFDIQQDAYPYQTRGGFAILQLSRWPVISLATVTQIPTFGSTVALTAGKDFRLDAENGALLRLNPFTGAAVAWEALPVTVVYAAGYGTAVQETGVVPASPGHQVTVAQASAFSCDLGVNYANGTPLIAMLANPLVGQYSVAQGAYALAAADVAQAVTFNYAISVIPPDLIGVCLRLITSRFMARGRDPALIERETPSIGKERWWFGNAPGQDGEFTPDIEAALDNFRQPVIA